MVRLVATVQRRMAEPWPEPEEPRDPDDRFLWKVAVQAVAKAEDGALFGD